METELGQFQKDLLESVREMSASRGLRAAEVRSLQMQECVDAYVSSSATHHESVAETENSDT
ncbi:hypothetical protein EI534_11315 [Pseudomonas frederiksbergensis]|nr:hypothetical protein [Pseudomonas frederiksbergensis]